MLSPINTKRRRLTTLGALLCCAALVALWVASVPASRAATTKRTVTGTLSSVGAYGFTLQTPGKPSGVISEMARAASTITAQNWPYVWGGGHALAGHASIGEPGGPGYNGKRKGYDCSGAVAAVLVAAGLWPADTSVPNDAYEIEELRQLGYIAPGPGTGPHEVTLYNWPGVHIFINIDGRFFGTSDGGGGGDAKGGPGWLDDSASDVSSKHFKRYHFLTSVLDASPTAGYSLGIRYPPSRGASVLGYEGLNSKVQVTYSDTKAGTMAASAVTYVNSYKLSGVVGGVTTSSPFTATGSLVSFWVTNTKGQRLFFTADDSSSAADLPVPAVGDKISIHYIRVPGLATGTTRRVAVSLKVTHAVTSGSGTGSTGATGLNSGK